MRKGEPIVRNPINALNVARVAAGLSTSDLAKLLGAPYRTIQDNCDGLHSVRAPWMENLMLREIVHYMEENPEAVATYRDKTFLRDGSGKTYDYERRDKLIRDYVSRETGKLKVFYQKVVDTREIISKIGMEGYLEEEVKKIIERAEKKEQDAEGAKEAAEAKRLLQIINNDDKNLDAANIVASLCEYIEKYQKAEKS